MSQETETGDATNSQNGANSANNTESKPNSSTNTISVTNTEETETKTDESNSNSKNDNKSSSIDSTQFLKYGILQHLEIEEFFMDDDNVDKHCTPQTWSNCDSTTFEVRRGPDYKPNSNQKAPSAKSLYEVFAVDAYKSSHKISKLSQFVNLTEKINELNKYGHEYNFDKWPLPPIVIINFMIPNYSPAMFGADKTDGDGFSLVLYAEMTNETRLHLEKLYKGEITKDELRPSIRLLTRFIHASENKDLIDNIDNKNNNSNNSNYNNNDENDSNNTNNKNNNTKFNTYGMSKEEISGLLDRFKIIVRVMNYSHTAMPYAMHPIVKNYNAKPFLARTSSTFYHEPGQYFGVDIDAHIFGKLARKSLGYLKGCMETVIFDGGFVIEGRENDELPEQVLASARVSKIGVKAAKPFPKHLFDQYMLRKSQNMHTHEKHDVNSRSCLTLKHLAESKKDETIDNASQTVPVISRNDVLSSETNNNNNNDSNNSKNNSSNDNTIDENTEVTNGTLANGTHTSNDEK